MEGILIAVFAFVILLGFEIRYRNIACDLDLLKTEIIKLEKVISRLDGEIQLTQNIGEEEKLKQNIGKEEKPQNPFLIT